MVPRNRWIVAAALATTMAAAACSSNTHSQASSATTAGNSSSPTASQAAAASSPAPASVASSGGSGSAGGGVPASSTAGADLATSFTTPSKPYTIDLSNNYVGNSWRLQMEKEAQVAAQIAPFSGVANVNVVTSQNTVQAQIQDLQNMISQKPDAILIDAGSPTALNATIQQACNAGIVVVSFDQIVTAPCAWKIGTDFGTAESELADWLVTVLGGKGQIAVDRGQPGTPVGEQMLQAELAVYKKFPGISVVSQFNGQYAYGPEKEGVSAALASHPDLVGATTDNWGSSALAAFQAAGKTKAAIIGWGPEGALVQCAQAHQQNPDINCIFGTNGPDLSILAMQLAVNVLQHKVAGTARMFFDDEVIYTTKVVPLPDYPNAKLTPIQLGQNALASLPAAAGIPWAPSFMTIDPTKVVPQGAS